MRQLLNMESSKKMMNKSDSSGDESDQQQQVKEYGTRRFYECTYCKRGFTNAQALGGHMNIHRKDRAKSCNQKHVANINNSSISKAAPSSVSHEHTQRYNMYVPQMEYSTSAYYPTNGERFGTNLGLRIGSEYVEESGVRRVHNDHGKEAVDLELRLGPYQY